MSKRATTDGKAEQPDERRHDESQTAATARRGRDAFLKLVAHELRTPLTTILGWLEVMSSDRDPKTVGQALEAIDRSARAQLSMLNRISDFVKYNLDTPTLANEVFDLSEAVADCVQTLDAKRVEKGHTLRYSPPSRPIFVSGDQDEMAKALQAVLENSYQYTPPSGSVSVNITPSHSSVVIEIEDNGVGIEPQALQRLLCPSDAGDEHFQTRGGGLGIGLVVARAIVNRHGGAISAESMPGSGSSFRLRLPLSLRHPDEAHQAPRTEV